MPTANITEKEFNAISDPANQYDFVTKRLQEAGFDLNKEWEEVWNSVNEIWVYSQVTRTDNDLDPEVHEPISRSRVRERQREEMSLRDRQLAGIAVQLERANARNIALQSIGRAAESTPELPPVESIPKRAVTLE